MKKKTVIILIIAIVLITVGLFVGYRVYKKKDTTVTATNPIYVYNELKEVNYPNFKLKIEGLIEKELTKQDLIDSKVKVYEFDGAVISSWGVDTDRYIGVKLFDVLDSLNIGEYTKLQFVGQYTNRIDFNANLLSKEDSYLVFYRNGQRIMDYDISLVNFNMLYSYSIEGLSQIYIHK